MIFFSTDGLTLKYFLVNDTVGMDDDDDEETVAVDHKRMRRESSLALRKLEKDDPGAKPKKKARVLVEVRVYESILCFFPSV